MQPTAASRARDRWVGLVLTGLALAGLYFMARGIDWTETRRALGSLGVGAAFVVVPYLLGLACDTLAWRNTFEHPAQYRFVPLLRLRVATEAVSNSLPAGPALAEAVKAVLLERRFGLPLADASANVLIAKIALAAAHALFVLSALLAAIPALRDQSQSTLGGAGLEWLALGVAASFALVVGAVAWILLRGRVFVRVLEHTIRLGGPRLRRLAERWQPGAERLEEALQVVARLPGRRRLRAVALFGCGFVCLGLENFVILRMLSSDVGFAGAISMEALLSIVRVVFFVVPSALGAQEAGYYLVLRAYGVPDPEIVAAAFMIVKRSKELFWIALGYASLVWLRARTV